MMPTNPEIAAAGAMPDDPGGPATPDARGPSPQTGASAQSLRGRAVRSSAWTIGGYGASNIFRLGSNLVLTRLFAREVFGILTLITIFIQGLQMFSDVGLGASIVQHPDADDADFLNTAWTIQVIRGAFLWICSWIIAAPLAKLYGIPSLVWLIPAAGLNALISGFYSTSLAEAARHLVIGRLTLMEMSARIFGFLVTIALCWWTRSVWAFIIAGLLAGMLTLLLSHTFIPGVRNRFCWNRRAAREVFKFGRWIFLSTILTFLAAQSDRLIFGKMIPIGLLGVYSIAVMLATLPTQAVLKIGSNVAFSAYSRVQDDAERFRSVFTRVRLPLLVGGGLIVVGLVGCGPAFLRLLWPRDFWEAGWMLQILAIGAWFQILEATCGAAVLATGAAWWVASGNAMKLAGMCLFITAGFLIDRAYGGNGFHGAIIGVTTSEVGKYLMLVLPLHRRGLVFFRRDLLLTLCLGVGCAAVLAAERGLLALGSNDFVVVLGCGLLACLLWLPLIVTTWRMVLPTTPLWAPITLLWRKCVQRRPERNG